MNLAVFDNQRGAAGMALGQPFVAVVTDEGGNVVAGTSVEFKVEAGGGHFIDGYSSYLTTTDSDGRASVAYVLGFEPGFDNHKVSATVVGQPFYAVFTASALTPGAPGNTSISGVVLDNQDAPIEGVTIRIAGMQRNAVTDIYGQFTITQVPVGPVHLIAEGATAVTPGEWPTLSQNIITVAGANNPLAAPIYMVKLDTANAQWVGDKDVSYTLPQVPGFKLDVKAGSVTFPDGSKTGQLSVTAVNASKVPMSPPNGMQPQFIVTIQPVGAVFDPPAPLTLPNVDGHAPGAEVEMYSFDHDLEEFVAIGLGTVSADGSVIESNTGVGVVKAGWHCGSQPGGSGTGASCGECATCDGKQCVPKDGPIGECSVCSGGSKVNSPWGTKTQTECKICDGAGGIADAPDGNACTAGGLAGQCCSAACATGKVVNVADITTTPPVQNGSVTVAPNSPIVFTATATVEGDCSEKYEWDFGDGTTGTGASVNHNYTAVGAYTSKVTVTCTVNTCADPVTKTVEVKVGNIKEIIASSAVATNNSVTFVGEKPYPFDPTENVAGSIPGESLVIFHMDAVNAGQWSVQLEAIPSDPAIKAEADLQAEWTVEPMYGAGSATLNKTGEFKRDLVGLNQGGLYKVKVTTPSGVSEANILLPLAGAEIGAIVLNDLILADAFAQRVSVLNIFEQSLRVADWFGDPNGNYLGRSDNSQSPTVWHYNSVADAPFAAVGKGAVVTWNGISTLEAKASNMLFGYAVYKTELGSVPGVDYFAQLYGTSNDAAGQTSYDVGKQVALSGNVGLIQPLPTTLYNQTSSTKHKQLWPNTAVTSNHVSYSQWTDHNRMFASPGFLEVVPIP